MTSALVRPAARPLLLVALLAACGDDRPPLRYTDPWRERIHAYVRSIRADLAACARTYPGNGILEMTVEVGPQTAVVTDPPIDCRLPTMPDLDHVATLHIPVRR